MKNISKLIVDCCKKEGINYCSIYLKNPELYEDAYKLKDIYLQLKEIAGDLEEISEKYNLENFNTLLVDDIKKLIEADHDIFKIMRKLIKE